MFLKRIALTAGLAALALAVPAAANASQPACIAAGSHAVRVSPQHLPAVYRACAPQMGAALRTAGITDTPTRRRALFATAVANHYAPYGNNRIVSTLDGLRPQPTLACYMYALLAVEIYDRVGGHSTDVTFVGWDHGAVGNHAQAIIGGSLLIDPTVGIVAPTTLHHLAYGGAARTLTMSHNAPGSFRSVVRDAIESGSYKRSDVLYVMTYQQAKTYNQAVVRATQAGGSWQQVPLPAFSLS